MISCLALLAWLAPVTYSQNYATREIVEEIRVLERQRDERLRQLRALRADWAWLTRPARIRDLADLAYPHIRMTRRRVVPPVAIDDLPFAPVPDGGATTPGERLP